MKEISINSYCLSEVCRLCLSRDASVLDIFAFSTKMNNHIANVIMDCAPVQITRHDEMPNFICQLCNTQLEKSHQFRVQVVQSDKTLRRYLHRLYDSDKQIKTECSNQGASDNALNPNTNAEIAVKRESLETHDVWQRKSPQIFNSVTENSNEMRIKIEVKDEPMDNNVIFPVEGTLSKDDDIEINCEDSKINIGNTVLGEGTYSDNLKKYEPENSKLALKINENTPFKCEIEDKPIDDNSLISEHVESTEENLLNYDGDLISDYVTENVNKREKGKRIISLNREKHKKANVTKLYQCAQCNKSFETSSALKKHKLTHTGEKPYQCDVCNECFNNSTYLKVHKRLHTGEKPYKCDVCHKCFNQSQYLKVHKRTHTGEKPYKCDICNKCFNESYNLKVHKRTHTGEKPHKCDVCSKCFNESQDLKTHKRIHTGEKPYKCDDCNKCFTQSQNLKRHKSVHTGEKPYKCDVCNKCFSESQQLRIHKRGHTGEKPYRCDVCNKCFVQSNSLSVHKRTHTGEKPYKCDVCNKCFIISHSLKIHKCSHASEKSYKCDL